MSLPIPIAIIANSQTPYRLFLHQRLVQELPQYQLWSVFTHEESNAPWKQQDAAAIRPVQFGAGESSKDQDKPARQGQEWRKGGRIIAWMREKGIRAVVMFGYNDLGRLRIMAYCKRNNIACFLFGDSNIKAEQVGGWKQRVKQMVLPLVFRLTHGAMYCGRLGKQYFAHYGLSNGFPFPYEADYGQIQGMPAARVAELTARFQLPEGRRFLLYSGRLASVKRVDLLAKAFARLYAERPEWDLLLVGDGPERPQLSAYLKDVPAARVHWAGFVDNAEVLAALYRRADVLVLPSDYEPWGVVVTEGAAAGLALVTSDVVGAAADLLVPGRNGEFFVAGDGESLLQALRKVTAADTVTAYRQASPQVLAEWRAWADPVRGLQAALQSQGVA